MNCIDYLFESSYSRDKYFILGQREQLTFEQLWSRITKLSDWLVNTIGQGEKVILSSANSSFFIVAYCAIMKSGNVCVPLNPAIEQTHFDFISKKTNAQLHFLSRQVAGRLQLSQDVIDEVKLEHCHLQEDVSPIQTVTNPDQLAQIIFTSGSTAEPKGVMISHRNIIANTSSIVDYLQLSEHDIMEVVLPFYYCYGLSLLHTHIRVGGSIVLNNNFMFLGSVINDLIKYKCTGFAGVPSHFQVLLRKSETFKSTHFPDLKYVTQAGGKLPTPFIKEFVQSFPDIKFFVMYGQTEATARLSYLPPNLLNTKLGSIGKGIPGVELKVVDEKGSPVNKGVVGEIIAKGDNIMLGYYDDPLSTSESIRNGWLHTGDLAILDEDGYIYLTARAKEIIKVGGRRISPKEIEEVILGLGNIVDCTVVGVEDPILGEAIKAIIVVNAESHTYSVEDIKKHCSEHLSGYKIPSFIEFEQKMDVVATGKKLKR